MSEEDKKYEDGFDSIKFPIIKNLSPKSLKDVIEGISSEDMPRRMADMFASAHNKAVETMQNELKEIRGVEGKEDRVKYLEDLLNTWTSEN